MVAEFRFWTCRLMAALLLLALVAPEVSAQIMSESEIPAIWNDTEPTDMLPISLYRGRVTNQASRYLLGPGDTLSIRIQDLEKFNQTITIRPDGFASVYPFGERYLAGTDIQGIQNWLAEELKTYLLKPAVTINVEQLRPAMIYVSGAVRRPGTYQYLRQSTDAMSTASSDVQDRLALTLTSVLGKAGGLTANADLSKITVMHTADGSEEHVDLLAFLKGEPATEDPLLQPDDRVLVPERDLPMDAATFALVGHSTLFREQLPIVVLGAVQSQGEVQLDPTNNTLNAAIAKAGGFVPGLSKRDAVIVQRPTPNGGFHRWVIKRDKTNLELLPGDVVYVPDSKTAWLERGMRFLGATSSPYFLGASATGLLTRGVIRFK